MHKKAVTNGQIKTREWPWPNRILGSFKSGGRSFLLALTLRRGRRLDISGHINWARGVEEVRTTAPRVEIGFDPRAVGAAEDQIRVLAITVQIYAAAPGMSA